MDSPWFWDKQNNGFFMEENFMTTSLHFRDDEESEEEEDEENQENGESDGKKADEVVSQDYPMARYVCEDICTHVVCYEKDAQAGIETNDSQLVTDL